MLSGVRTSSLVDEMVEAGEFVDVAIEESTRRYLAVPEFLKAKSTYDDRVRILGPLDPLLWDRDLVRHVFGFDYVWRSTSLPQRRWAGTSVLLLHRDRLIGRIDARIERDALVVKKLWLEGTTRIAPQSTRPRKARDDVRRQTRSHAAATLIPPTGS
jgi:uncharacterized protein YcaQ